MNPVNRLSMTLAMLTLTACQAPFAHLRVSPSTTELSPGQTGYALQNLGQKPIIKLGPSLSLAATTENGKGAPALAWSEPDDTTLLVWREENTIMGQTFTATGKPLRDQFSIANAVHGEVFDPVVAYQPNARVFLVAFPDQGGGTYIFGQLISADGTLLGDKFSIAEPPQPSSFRGFPAVAANTAPGSTDFLVTWMDGRNHEVSETDIYGQLLSVSNGQATHRYPADQVISARPSNQFYPSVSYNRESNGYLVAFTSANPASFEFNEIRGEWLNHEGVPSGNINENFRISDPPVASDFKFRPSVVANLQAGKREYLVAWDDERQANVSDRDLYGQIITAGPDGQLSRRPEDAALAQSPGRDASSRGCFDPATGNYLVVFESEDAVTGNDAVKALTTSTTETSELTTLSQPHDEENNFNPAIARTKSTPGSTEAFIAWTRARGHQLQRVKP